MASLVLDATSTIEGRRARAGDGVTFFEVDHRADRLAHAVMIRDGDGRAVAALNERLTRVGRCVVIERPNAPVAFVRALRATATPQRWVVTMHGGGRMEVYGGLVDCQFRVVRNGRTIAECICLGGTRNHLVLWDRDQVLVLAVVLALEQLARYG
jgi:uncharacterized protein YxjI